MIQQEEKRRPGSRVDNWSWKINGWGSARLRGPGAWDRRMETLLSSKHLLRAPGDHVSHDCLGLCLFAHGANLSPRYGYDWRGYPDFLLNRGRIDDLKDAAVWGDFLPFDGHPEIPSAAAYTDRCGKESDKPGPARQERWCVQFPEYLFDAYLMKPRDGREPLLQLGFHNIGEAAVVTPAGAPLSPAKNPDGTPWDPFGHYRKETGREGMSLTPDGPWQVEWTMNEGGLWDRKDLPRGSRLRLTQTAAPGTEVGLAWLKGGRRQESDPIRQDFVVARRRARETGFIGTWEPIAAGAEPFVRSLEAVESNGAFAVKGTTAKGADWILFGGLPDFAGNLEGSRTSCTLGPFTTDAARAWVRVQGGRILHGMLAGGTKLVFRDGDAKAEYTSPDRATYHFSGGPLKGGPPPARIKRPGLVGPARLEDRAGPAGISL